MPHDGVLVAQLHRDRVDEDGADADDKIQGSVHEDLGAQLDFLRFRCQRQHLAQVLARELQSGDWRDDAVFHRGVCVLDDAQEGSLVDLFNFGSRCYWSCHREWGMSVSCD